MQAFNDEVIRRLRAGEEIDGLHREGLLPLTIVGRRSDDRRTAPMMFVEHDGDPLVIASNDGATERPFWFLNLRAEPHVTVETPDGSIRAAIAAVRADLVAGFPFFADQQERAGGRVIPLVRLRTAS